MTNNPTIDGVSRELTEAMSYYFGRDEVANFKLYLLREFKSRDKPVEPAKCKHEFIYFGRSDLPRKCRHCNEPELCALLDAPAVERQEPVTLAGLLEKNTIVVKVDVYDEQQATIARLEARIAQLESEAEFAAATYQAARDRIAELESGRGEPVALVEVMGGGAQIWKALKTQQLSVGVHELFTAPPAPVALGLPERADASTGSHDAQQGWNACLDATAALNEKSKQ